MSLMKFKNRKGFTLIEMMIVIAVIAILAAVLIPKSGIVQNTAKEAGVEANARVVQGLVENMLPRYGSGEGSNFREDLKARIDDSLTNPIIAGNEVKESITAGASVVVSDTAYGSAYTKEDAKGIVYVEVKDDLSSVIITPFDGKGNPITPPITIP